MVTNGYASKLEEEAAPLTQRVRLGIDLAEAGATGCCWINPETGYKPKATNKNHHDVLPSE